MSDIKLFRVSGDNVEELDGSSFRYEKNLQALLEKHLNTFLGVRFVATEYDTGKTHAGRIDTIGLDENGRPVIIEYKRSSNANVINQGLFYLDWMMDHKAEFELLVLKKFGQEVADKIDWSAPRLLCIAESFPRYDAHAVQQMNRNIELLRYVRFGEDLLVLDLVNVVTAQGATDDPGGGSTCGSEPLKQYTTQAEYLEKASDELKTPYGAVRDCMLEMGDDVQERFLKWYIVFKRLKNFATLQLQTQKNSILIWLPLDPKSITLEEGFSRDVKDVGHHGTGDLEVTIRSLADLERARPFIQRSFEEN